MEIRTWAHADDRPLSSAAGPTHALNGNGPGRAGPDNAPGVTPFTLMRQSGGDYLRGKCLKHDRDNMHYYAGLDVSLEVNPHLIPRAGCCRSADVAADDFHTHPFKLSARRGREEWGESHGMP